MVPELNPPSPAKKFFTKMAKSLFGKRKSKGKAITGHFFKLNPLRITVRLFTCFFWISAEKNPSEEKEDISKLVSGMVKHSISRQISHKTVGVNEVCVKSLFGVD